MSLEERLANDLTAAMRAKDADKLTTLRMLKAAITNTKIEQKKETFQDVDLLPIIQKQAKQRRESLESFEAAGRTDLAEKEKRELEILEAYLPKQLSDDEIKSIVVAAISVAGATSKGDIAAVMKEVMPKVKGKADGKRVNQIVLEQLS
ncbi:MAG: GatB/YqeY domain-containing protein [Candidatus Omnitrophota bacterium]|nr:GatB/YqeY domain-containing protein [Candidatus Omnitrophota bacterium]